MTRRLPNLSIRTKLMLIIMLTSSIALLLACVAFVLYDRNTFQQTMVQDLTTIASVIGDNSTAPLAFDDQDTATETLSALRVKPGIIAACLYRKDGRPFAIYHRAGAADEFAPPAVQPSASAFTSNRLVLFREIHLRGERIGTIYIESDLAELNLRLRRYAGIVALILLVCLLVAFLLSSKLQNIISRPLLHLAETARAVSSAKDYSIRATKHVQDELGALIDGFNEMLAEIQERDDKLQRSRNFYLTLLEDFPLPVWLSDAEGEGAYQNKAWERLTGRTAAEEAGHGWAMYIHPDDVQRCFSLFMEALETRETFELEYRLRCRDDEYRHILCVGRPFHNVDEQFAGYIGVCFDLTDRKLAEAQIHASLREKEVLLKEIHHRVKNNLQIITSLLSLQTHNVKDEAALTILQDSRNRVKSMALIHEALYQSDDLSQVNFNEYLRKLVAHVARTYRLNAEGVRLAFDVGDIALAVDTAVPCGLIVNELVSNSLKHGFPANQAGEVKISFHAHGKAYHLEVSDNGVGIPEDLNMQTAPSLGLKLVRMLTEQLEGELQVANQPGARLEVIFPMERGQGVQS